MQLTLYQMCFGVGNPVTVHGTSTSDPSTTVMNLSEGPRTSFGGIPATVKVPLSVAVPVRVEATQV